MIRKGQSRELLRIADVPEIHNNMLLHQAGNSFQIKPPISVPFRQNHQAVGPINGI